MDYTKYVDKSWNKTKTLVDLLLTVLEYETKGFQAIKRKGFCSNYLSDIDIGESIFFYIKESSFHLPPNLLHQKMIRPILMIGTGSGIAPFRGFWQQMMVDSLKTKYERLLSKKYDDIVQKIGTLELSDHMANIVSNEESKNSGTTTITMFFGCRDKGCNLLEHETNVYSEIMTRFDAFSREPNCPKQYVSDVMRKEHHLIYNALVEQNGLIYVCGKTAMADTVFKTLVSIIAEQLIEKHIIEHSESANETAEVFTNTLIDDGRYYQDIFGSEDV
jgi:nitric-oxide synthase